MQGAEATADDSRRYPQHDSAAENKRATTQQRGIRPVRAVRVVMVWKFSEKDSQIT